MYIDLNAINFLGLLIRYDILNINIDDLIVLAFYKRGVTIAAPSLSSLIRSKTPVMIMSQDVSNGNHNNLPFSIDNILREDFRPQKEHVSSYPSGSYIGIPRFYYRYNPWTFARWNFLGRVVPLHTGAAALHQRPIDLETSEQQEKVINVDCTKDCRSDSECSDSDESGKNQATAINQGLYLFKYIYTGGRLSTCITVYLTQQIWSFKGIYFDELRSLLFDYFGK